MSDKRDNKKILFPSGHPSEVLKDPEIVIALVGPVGTDLAALGAEIRSVLNKLDYEVEKIKLSDLVCNVDKYDRLVREKESQYEGTGEFARIRARMFAGTQARKDSNRGDFLALMAIDEIRERRLNLQKAWYERQGNEPPPDKELKNNYAPGTAYLLHSFKHPDEIRLIRRIYGLAAIVISLYSPRNVRAEKLANRISKSSRSSAPAKNLSKAHELIEIDENEEERKDLGQSVGDAFHLADLFLDERKTNWSADLSRFFDAYFGSPFVSPTKDEFAMYMATASAMRSSDMSRQVGASIATADGDVVALGCNDVPAPGGGLYWETHYTDARDFKQGQDISVEHKRLLLEEVIDGLRAGQIIDDAVAQKISESLSDGRLKDLMKDTHASNVIEYGRSVHAEMASLMSAAERGVSVRNDTLFSTTFPCHLCARHIVAAGIKRVVYIEPYPKSLVRDLYNDSIALDGDRVDGKVAFEPFVGIAPRTYSFLFKHEGKRKDSKGKPLEWLDVEPQPRIDRYVATYVVLESKALAYILQPILSEIEKS